MIDRFMDPVMFGSLAEVAFAAVVLWELWRVAFGVQCHAVVDYPYAGIVISFARVGGRWVAEVIKVTEMGHHQSNGVVVYRTSKDVQFTSEQCVFKRMAYHQAIAWCRREHGRTEVLPTTGQPEEAVSMRPDDT